MKPYTKYIILGLLISLSSNLIAQDEGRIPMDSVGNGQPPFIITEPGSYFFTKNITSAHPVIDGITIDASHVTLDLNGYTLKADPNVSTGDAIFVSGDHDNITIQNGFIEEWFGDGVKTNDADQSTFKNLTVRNNGGRGIITDQNCLVINCSAFNNGDTGIEVDDGSVVTDCIASQNGENGIQTSEGCIVLRCTAYSNGQDGFDLSIANQVENCVAYRNVLFGFDVALSGKVINCNSYENGGNGYDIASSCLLMNSKGSGNGYCLIDPICAIGSTGASSLGSWGNGVRAFSNSQIINCTFNNNELTGIRVSSTDTRVSGNQCNENKNLGIYNQSGGCIFVGNICHNNGSTPNSIFFDSGGTVLSGNFYLQPTSAFGPIVNMIGGGDISNNANSSHPFANFEY